MTAVAVPTEVGLAGVLWRAIRAEWARLWTVRSTWWTMLAAMAGGALMGTAFGMDSGEMFLPAWMAGEFTISPGQLALLAVTTLAVTAEYSTGAIYSTLQWVPNRGLLLTARTLVAVFVAVVFGVLVAAVADVTAWLFLPDPVVVWEDVWRSLGNVALLMTAASLLTVGLALVLRSTAATLTVVFLLLLGLPLMLPPFEVRWLTAVAEHLPGHANVTLLESMQIELDTATRTTVLAAWPLAAMVAGAWSLLRRDAA